jgi:hypothetical protein
MDAYYIIVYILASYVFFSKPYRSLMDLELF